MDLLAQPALDYLGDHGSTRRHTNAAGIGITSYYWPAHPMALVKGIICIIHGHGGYLTFDWLTPQPAGQLSVYEGSFVQRLNAAGYAVCGNDNRGAGRSGGLRCYCDSFDDYVNDLLELANTCTTLGLRGFDAGVPKFVCGHSKGGCVALTAALKQPEVFSGAVCLAPMVSLEKVAKKGLNPYLRPLGSLLSFIIPQKALLHTDRNAKFPDLQEAYDKDPNCYHDKTRVRNAQEYLRATEWLVANQHRLKLPLLLFHADGDTMTDPEGTKRLWDAAQSTDKTIIAPPGMWHVLLKEPGHETIEQQVMAWLDAHCK